MLIKLVQLCIYYENLASRSDRENFLFLIGMIVIIIGILVLLLAYVFFPIHSFEFTIGQTAISENLIWKIYLTIH